MTIVYFLNVEKYPPSLQYLLMTVGPSLLLLWWLERFGRNPIVKKLTGPILVFGCVPMFFWLLARKWKSVHSTRLSEKR